MSAPGWLNEVQRELTRRRLPRHEVARLVAELSDHFADVRESRTAAGACPPRGAARPVSITDLKEEELRMEASIAETLGSPAEIAETAVREFRRRKNLLSRSPLAAFCTFVLLPLPALCLAWGAAIAAMLLVGNVFDCLDVPDPSASRDVTGTEVLGVFLVLHLLMLLPAAGAAATFARLSRRATLRWGWGLAACVVVGLGTGLARIEATFSDIPGKSTLTFGVGIEETFISLQALGQLVIPLAAGLLVLRPWHAPSERSPGPEVQKT